MRLLIAHPRSRLVALAFVVLVALTLVSYGQMRSRHRTVLAAWQDVHTCTALTADIIELRQRPQFAAVETDSTRSTADRIEEATQQSSLPASAVVRIQPQPPNRVGDSPYRIRPTRLELRQVTLEQLVRFAHQLVDEDQGLTVRDLRLWRPAGEPAEGPGQQETWSAEITVTQLTFAPAP